MRNLLAAVLVLIMGFFIFTSLYSADSPYPRYGEVNLQGRVSQAYVDKNVNGDNGPVIFQQTKDAESGSANLVTSIVVNYRSFDTLGEVTVLFVSALGVALVLGEKKQARRSKAKVMFSDNFILRQGSRVIVGLVLLVGVYIIAHGHLSPGGGFPGGSMIAAAVLLLYLSEPEFRTNMHMLKVTEGLAGSLYVVAGLVGLLLGGYFLENFLPTGTVGTLFSAGLIPLIYVLIGLKVGAELSGLITDFLATEVEQ